MLAKRFVSSKSRGGFDKNKLEKCRIVPKKHRSQKKNKIGIQCAGPLRKPNFETIKKHNENLTIPKIVKGVILWVF